jgi:GT2 family glycosyltransferase
MTRPLVHAVVVNWNNLTDTIACVRSLAASDYPNLRIVVVDNGSTDGSGGRLRDQLPDAVHLASEENAGFGGGCNLGIAHALKERAAFVWLINNDAVAQEDALSHMVAVAEADYGVGAVGSVVRDMEAPHAVQAWGGGRINRTLGIERHFTGPVDDARLDWITAASILLRVEAVRTVGVFSEAFFLYWEDVDLGFRLRRAGWRLAVAREAVVWHKHAATLGPVNPLGDAYFNRSAAVFFSKHHRAALVPTVIGVMGRTVKQVARGNWARAGAALKGGVGGWHDARGTPTGDR